MQDGLALGVEEDIEYSTYIGSSSAEESLVKINFRY